MKGSEHFMGLTILKKKSGYALGLVLCIIGVILLLVVVWKSWQQGIFNSTNPLSDFYTLLMETYSDIDLGIGLKPAYYTILGFVLLIAGGIILAVRRERVRVVEEVKALLECPLCKNHWQEPLAKAQLKSMGYPEARTLTRRRCSNCGKFIRPKIVSTQK